MCVGGLLGGGPDSSEAAEQQAAEARRREEERQARIAAEVGQINEQFAGYDDNFYSGISQNYLDHYLPDLNRQFEDARRSTVLAAPGGTAGSAYSKSFENLFEEKNRQEAALRDRAEATAQEHRSNVLRNKASLIQQAEAAGGSGTAATQAAALAQNLRNPQPYSPLGDLFQRYTANLANMNLARQYGYGKNDNRTGITFANRPSDSVTMVG